MLDIIKRLGAYKSRNISLDKTVEEKMNRVLLLRYTKLADTDRFNGILNSIFGLVLLSPLMILSDVKFVFAFVIFALIFGVFFICKGGKLLLKSRDKLNYKY